MAINKNHEFEELNGVKCSIVERNASPERVSFLQDLLQVNSYKVIVIPSPAPKVAAAVPKPAITEGSTTVASEVPAPASPAAAEAPQTFTVGVTDVTFNPTNAIFGRLLHTRDGHIVTLAYWRQEQKVSHDEVPYYEEGNKALL